MNTVRASQMFIKYKNQSEVEKYIYNWSENTLEVINNRLDNKEEQINDLEDKVVEITQKWQQNTNYVRHCTDFLILYFLNNLIKVNIINIWFMN